MRPIDADELLKSAWFCDLDHWSGKVVDEDIINNTPTLDVTPFVLALWEDGPGRSVEICGDWYMRNTYICSNCREEENRKTPYCPNCGACMDLGGYKMKLKFIGTDGSLGLKHGKTYDITLKTIGKFVVAIIKTGWVSDTLCPYVSMKAFAANWELEDKHGEC